MVTVLALSVSLLAGCGSTAASPVSSAASTAAESTTSSVVSEATSAAADENAAAAAQLLNDLTGSYQELWPVILADEYKQTWLDDCTALVGEDNAEAAFEKLSSMVTGDVYGEDAVKAYANGGGAYFCGFTNDLATLTFDGEASTISGTDKDGNELFSHPYHYIGMEPVRGLYEFESDDADSGEFTYFSSRQTPVRKPTTLSFAMVRMQMLWVSMMQAIMLTGWHPAFLRIATRR